MILAVPGVGSNSVAFARSEAQSKGKLAASGGRALYRDYVNKMIIPTVPSEYFSQIVELMERGIISGLGQHDLILLDSIFSEAFKLQSRGRKAIHKLNEIDKASAESSVRMKRKKLA